MLKKQLPSNSRRKERKKEREFSCGDTIYKIKRNVLMIELKKKRKEEKMGGRWGMVAIKEQGRVVGVVHCI